MIKTLLASAVLSFSLLAAPALADQTIETVKGSVDVPAAPERIVILNPALAGSVYALGLDVLAVVQSTRAPTEEGYSSVWAEQARASQTQVLPWDFAGFNLEAILGLQPDLIIAGGSGRPGFLANEVYDQLSAIAPTVFVDTKPTAWQNELTFMAEAFGLQAEADTVLQTYADRVEDVKTAIALPPQPTVFILAIEPGAAPYFLPETSSTPQLFADVGFEPDPLAARYPDFEAGSTGDGVQVSLELASEVLVAPTMIFLPFTAGQVSLDFEADPVLSRLPSLAADQAYEFPDYTYRFDYYGAMATLNEIESIFAK